ncbi:PCYCGC motif-containing (lipo)protein [Bacillus sp. NEB1478]|uniref:PCYCGC motif-containing (lipo)protein n=1 Tax=Bacillus sp. NEB1478 TaxID=3073816 RepID=UPI002872B7C1|nr:PCYCGC motif-containing (lipo)protein [Bacillus sp. NEB1478]WNB91441.1 PCYCGC motif-containing (lipo)protein [Bacillus sp. NEB1478]
MKKKQLILTMTLAAGFLISGCGNQKDNDHKNHNEHSQSSQEKNSHSQHTEHTANGDIQELTASMDSLPAFLDKQPKEIASIYSAVPHYKNVLESMPCYCGCGESAGHKNNYDCFIADNKEDGQIVWDDHGTKCGTCLEIAAYSMQQAEAGKSALEIRKMVDENYKDGYAKPTPTPMPAS